MTDRRAKLVRRCRCEAGRLGRGSACRNSYNVGWEADWPVRPAVQRQATGDWERLPGEVMALRRRAGTNTRWAAEKALGSHDGSSCGPSGRRWLAKARLGPLGDGDGDN